MIRFRCRLLIPGLAIPWLVGCATAGLDLNEAAVVRLETAGRHAVHLRGAVLHEDARGQVLRGKVWPGNRSHIPRPHFGHIDILVAGPKGVARLVGVVPLRGRQRFFSYRFERPVAPGDRVILAYRKTFHRAHREKPSDMEPQGRTGGARHL